MTGQKVQSQHEKLNESFFFNFDLIRNYEYYFPEFNIKDIVKKFSKNQEMQNRNKRQMSVFQQPDFLMQCQRRKNTVISKFQREGLSGTMGTRFNSLYTLN